MEEGERARSRQRKRKSWKNNLPEMRIEFVCKRRKNIYLKLEEWKEKTQKVL